MAHETPKLATCCPSLRTVTGWTILFMVLLRIAIGWHFFYEGAWKLAQPDWRATHYLLASSGPCRPLFRAMVRDPDGLERLTADSVKERIDTRYKQLVEHYGLNEAQQQELEKFKEYKKTGDPNNPNDKVNVDAVFADPDFLAQKGDYETLLRQIAKQEKKLGETEFEKQRLVDMYGKKAKALAALLARAEQPLKAVELYVRDKQLDEEQLAKGPLGPERSQTWLIDWANMIALTAVGVCLMLGFFTRLAALGGIGLLALYYFAMPPWPGLPENPMAEGHYLIIDKNLIEMIALFMIATSGIGRWGGLDAFCASRKLKRAARATPERPV